MKFSGVMGGCVLDTRQLVTSLLNFIHAFCIQQDASFFTHMENIMKTKTEIKALVAGTDITPDQFIEMVNIVGEERAIEMVNSQKPKAETVGFANEFKDGNLQIKVALNEQKRSEIANHTNDDGYTYLILNMIPNLNASGWHVGENFVETMQSANARKDATEGSSDFRYTPFMKNSEETSAKSSSDPF